MYPPRRVMLVSEDGEDGLVFTVIYNTLSQSLLGAYCSSASPASNAGRKFTATVKTQHTGKARAARAPISKCRMSRGLNKLEICAKAHGSRPEGCQWASQWRPGAPCWGRLPCNQTCGRLCQRLTWSNSPRRTSRRVDNPRE